MRIILFLNLIIFFTMSCSNMQQTGNEISSEIESLWFENGKWIAGLPGEPDSSINIDEFKEQYTLKPGLWDKAFDFMRDTDLNSLTPGKYMIIEDSLYYIVEEYITKNEEETRFEAHRKYADIQYLISGMEKIGVQPLSNAEKVLQDYDKTKDIGFYEISGNNFRKADQNVFFIFFPDDAHRPCVKIDSNIRVKKIVFKIKVID